MHCQRIYHQSALHKLQYIANCIAFHHLFHQCNFPLSKQQVLQVQIFELDKYPCQPKPNRAFLQRKGFVVGEREAVKIRSAFPQIGTTKEAKNKNQNIELCVYLFRIDLFSHSLQARFFHHIDLSPENIQVQSVHVHFGVRNYSK